MVVIGNALHGPLQLAMVVMGLVPLPLRNNLPVGCWPPLERRDNQPLMDRPLRVTASEDCVLSFRTSGPNYRTKQMASGDARDPWVTSQQIGTQSLKRPKNT